MRVAVLRCERLPGFVDWEIPDVEALFADDRAYIEALRARGIHAEPVPWSQVGVDWGRYDAAVLRSTWDYVDHLSDFLDTTARIAASGCTLLNPLEAVHWNADKRYLDELARLDVPIVPIVRGSAGAASRLLDAVAETGWGELVLKPAIGVGGAGVVRTDASRLAEALGAMPADVEVMVQPFARAVLDEGELSFVFLGGTPSHVLAKRPAPGDFRAHGIYGGTVTRTDAEQDDLSAVEEMLGRLPFELLYARVDVVRFDGRLSVLELELIEPMLYLELAQGSAGRLADATIARLGRG